MSTAARDIWLILFDTRSLAQGIAHAIEKVSPADVRQRAIQHCSLERQAANYSDVYEKMLSGAGKRL